MSSTGANGRCRAFASCETTSSASRRSDALPAPSRRRARRRRRRPRAAVLDRDADPPRGSRRAAPRARGRLALELRPLLRRQRRVELVDPVQQPAELEAAEDLLHRRAVGRARDERRRVDVEREVAAHRRELLRRARLVGVLAHRLPARGRELVGVRDHLLERAVLRDQLAGGLVADPGDARDVVGRVALEPDEVRHLVGPDAVAELDALGRVDVDVGDAARRHHQRHVLGAELEGVAVGRDDARLHARLVGARRERGDDVVRLPALELEVPVAERLDDRPEVRELLAEEVRHRPPALLVDDVRRLGDGGAVRRARVPRDRDPARPVVREQLEEHVPEAEQRVRRHPVARRELLREREEGAVGEVVAVDEEELGVAGGPVVELELRPRDRLRGHASESMQDRPPRRSGMARVPSHRHATPRAPSFDPASSTMRRPARGPHAAHRAVEPALPAAYEREEVDARGDRGAAHGRRLGRRRDAQRHRRRLPASARRGPTRLWGANVWVEAAGHAVERARGRRATSTRRGGPLGRGRHGPRTTRSCPRRDGALVDAWFRVGFGQQHVHAIREAPASPLTAAPARRRHPPADARRHRRARGARALPAGPPAALAVLLRRAAVVARGGVGRSGTRTSTTRPSRPSSASVDGRVVGSAIGCSVELSSLHTGHRAARRRRRILGFAAVLADARGRGVGSALGDDGARLGPRARATARSPPTGARRTCSRRAPGRSSASGRRSTGSSAPIV